MSFYNIDNEEISQEGILNDLIDYYQTLGDENKTKVTDFNEGSEVRTLLEVMSHLAYNILVEQNETLKSHFINSADGEYLDLLGENPNVNLPRIQGTTARGLVKFSIQEESSTELIIPADTTVYNDDVEYVTIEDGIISIGDTYTYIPVECVIDGEEGNCLANTIVNCELPDYTVTNDEPFTDGSDFEEDEAYRQRLLDYVRADNFGSRGYYENILLGMTGVHDIVENDDPSASIDYYVNTNDVSISSDVYAQILEYFTDNNHFVVGHSYNFNMSKLHTVDFKITVNSDCGYLEDDIKDYIKCWFKGGDMQNYPFSFQGLNMGEEISSSDITTPLMESFMDITSATISNISNTYGSSTTSSFDFISTDEDHSAYSIGTVTVVFG